MVANHNTDANSKLDIGSEFHSLVMVLYDLRHRTVTTETIDLGQETLSRVREVGSVLYLNKQNASYKVLSEVEQIRDCELRTS